MSITITRKEIAQGVAEALKNALVKHESAVAELQRREAAGAEVLAKSEMCKSAGCTPDLHKCGTMKTTKNEVEPMMMSKNHLDAHGTCPACGGSLFKVGDHGDATHFVCRGCGADASSKRSAGGTTPDKDAMSKGEIKEVVSGSVVDKPAPDAKLPEGSKEVGSDTKPKEMKKSGLSFLKGGPPKVHHTSVATQQAMNPAPPAAAVPAQAVGTVTKIRDKFRGSKPAGGMEKTSVAEANKELSNFRSVASNPTAMPHGNAVKPTPTAPTAPKPPSPVK